MWMTVIESRRVPQQFVNHFYRAAVSRVSALRSASAARAAAS
jgi:hypothetical protein